MHNTCLQLCHLASVITALRGERVVYIDATNGFCASRAAQMARQAGAVVRCMAMSAAACYAVLAGMCAGAMAM
jgi:hypothetical protein